MHATDIAVRIEFRRIGRDACIRVMSLGLTSASARPPHEARAAIALRVQTPSLWHAVRPPRARPRALLVSSTRANTMQAAARHAVRAAQGASGRSRRTMAIVATVKTAPDTSAIDFPAPSHASLTGDAVDIARQIKSYYSSPESVLKLDENARAAILEDLGKKVSAIPDSTITAEWVSANVKVPEEVVLGDNPVFQGLRK